MSYVASVLDVSPFHWFPTYQVLTLSFQWLWCVTHCWDCDKHLSISSRDHDSFGLLLSWTSTQHHSMYGTPTQARRIWPYNLFDNLLKSWAMFKLRYLPEDLTLQCHLFCLLSEHQYHNRVQPQNILFLYGSAPFSTIHLVAKQSRAKQFNSVNDLDSVSPILRISWQSSLSSG